VSFPNARLKKRTMTMKEMFVDPLRWSWYVAFFNSFSLKTHQMFSVRTTLQKCENATATGHFGIVFDENSGREIT